MFIAKILFLSFDYETSEKRNLKESKKGERTERKQTDNEKGMFGINRKTMTEREREER